MRDYWRTHWKKLIIALIVAVAVGFGLYLSGLDTLPQASFPLFDRVMLPTSKDRVLIVAPHQDDEVLGAGDYIQRSVSVGAKVEIVFATDGNKQGKKNFRRAEAYSVGQELGLTNNQMIFFDFPDGNLSELSQYDKFVARLNSEIALFGPTIVITTLPEDEHSDHAASGRAVKALLAQGETFKALFFLIHADRYPRPIGDAPDKYLLPPLKLVNNYSWQVFVPTADEQSQKRSAINLYRSQMSVKNPILRQLLQSFDRRNELFAQVTL